MSDVPELLQRARAAVRTLARCEARGDRRILTAATNAVCELLCIKSELAEAGRQYGADVAPFLSFVAKVALDCEGEGPIDASAWSAAEAALETLNVATWEGTREPLSPNARKVYHLLLALPEHEAMTGPAILDALQNADGTILDQSTLTKRIFPELEPYGLQNKPRIGYYIPVNKRPKKG